MKRPDTDRLCLFLDVDGTLIDIASRPESVMVPGALKRALQRIADACEGAVALVSGRTIANLDALFTPLRLCASGVHGAEVRLDPAGPVAVADDDRLDPALLAAVEALAAGVAGSLMEDKAFSAAVHYRLAPKAGPFLGTELQRLVAQSGDRDLRILPGHMVFEIKRASFDKGTAIRRFMAQAPFQGRTPVFIGDDVTDEPGFEAVLEYGGEAYSVGRLFEGVTGSFPDPAAVRLWLADLAESETFLA